MDLRTFLLACPNTFCINNPERRPSKLIFQQSLSNAISNFILIAIVLFGSFKASSSFFFFWGGGLEHRLDAYSNVRFARAGKTTAMENGSRLFSNVTQRKLAARTFIQSQYLKALAASLRFHFCDEWKRALLGRRQAKQILVFNHLKHYNYKSCHDIQIQLIKYTQ